MLTEERQAEIVRLVNAGGTVSVQDLVNYLDISESTVRRDLVTLDQEGRLKRVHGGAKAVDCPAYEADLESLQEKYSFHMLAKRRIAQYAAGLIQKQDFVYIDAGSTTEQMAEFLTNSEATFVTNSLPMAQKLGRSGVNVYMLPGRVKEKTEAIVGSEMRSMLVRYHFTKGFFGTNGISLTAGCTTPDDEEAACKQAAVHQCRHRYILADASKFGLSSHITFARLSEVTILTTASQDTLDLTPYQQVTEVHVL